MTENDEITESLVFGKAERSLVVYSNASWSSVSVVFPVERQYRLRTDMQPSSIQPRESYG